MTTTYSLTNKAQHHHMLTILTLFFFVCHAMPCHAHDPLLVLAGHTVILSSYLHISLCTYLYPARLEICVWVEDGWEVKQQR